MLEEYEIWGSWNRAQLLAFPYPRSISRPGEEDSLASTPVQLIVERDELSLSDLSDLASAFAGYLSSLDVATSPTRRATLAFRLSTISYHSPLTIEAAADPREDAADNGPAVATLGIRGIEAITAGRPPEHFPHEALEHLRRLAHYTTNGEAAGIVIRAPTLQLAAAVTSVLVGQVERVLAQGDAIGAIEGSLDTISVHSQPYFTLFDAVTGRGVKCYFSEDMRARVVYSLGKRMLVHGRLRREHGGAPREMRDLDHMEELGRPEGSPDRLAGVFAGLDVKAYLAEIRGE